MQLHQNAFVFEDSERGTFCEDHFSLYIISYRPHILWAFANIPIPPGLKDQVIKLLKEKMAARVYEPSQSSYRSQWFYVPKKNGKLWILYDLQPMNDITIKESGLLPNLDSFVKPFAEQQCYTVLDLYWGFNARKVHLNSQDLTIFCTPLWLLHITSLPSGYINSPSEFRACMVYILQDEIPHVADIFIDDLAIKGPSSQYLDSHGQPKTIPSNSGIQQFIWEHVLDAHQVIYRVKRAGETFWPTKV